MGEFSVVLFNGLLERIIRKLYAFAESIGESVEIRLSGESVQFWIDTTGSGGNAEYVLSVIPGKEIRAEVSWGSQDFYDAWLVTPGNRAYTVQVEYTGTVDENRRFPEWLDFGDWKIRGE